MATKEEILDYATNTPENTNRNVLNGMLDNYGGEGGGSGGNVLYVKTIESGGATLADKTWGEILAAIENGPVFIRMYNAAAFADYTYPVTFCIHDPEAGWYLEYCEFSNSNGTVRKFNVVAAYSTPETDYPILDAGGSPK